MKFRNKRILSLFLSIALVIGILVGAAPAFAEEAAKVLTIVHVNDMHGRYDFDDYEGAMGFGRLKAKVDELRVANPNLLLFDSGDAFHGTTDINLTEGKAMVKLMNLLGFDAMVPGNHDFNYGYEELLELKEMAEFPILGANIVKEANGESDFEPYTIIEIDGLKIGVFGLGTPETKFKSHPDNTKGIEFIDEIESAKKSVKELQDKGVDVIIGLAHLGIAGTSTTTSKELAENVEGIDLIIDGHSHEILNEKIGDTLLVQSESYLKNIGIVNMEITDGKVSNMEASLFTFEEAKELTPDPEIEVEVAAIKESTEPIKKVIIGKSNIALDGERANVRTGETNLGNLITDAMRTATGADIAFANGGGIRASIPEGDISKGHILTAFPFTNTLAVIEITGAELLEALEHGVDLYPGQAGHFPHVSGMTYKIDAGLPVGERIVEVTIGGETLDVEKKYSLVTNDFMAAGGDGYTMFDGKSIIGEGGLLSDVLIEYVVELQEVDYAVEGRITIIPAPVVVEPEPTPEPAPAPEVQKYVVKTDDVLWKIARAFNTTWEKLAEYNNLKNPHLIFPNQVILIP